MAATQPRKTPTRDNWRHPVLGFVQKAGTVIYKGTMAMHVAGVWQPADSGVNGAIYGGIAEETYDARTAGADQTYATPMVFKRVPASFDGKSGDLPTATNLGDLIAVEDETTVKATAVSHDVMLRLLEIEGSRYWVEPA